MSYRNPHGPYGPPWSPYGQAPAPAPGHQQPSWPPPPGSRPDMNVQTFQDIAQQPQVIWTRSSVADPQPLIPHATDGTLAIEYNTRTKRFSGNAAGQSYTETVQFDRASTVYARSAGIRTANLAAFTFNGSPLNTFDVQFRRTQKDFLDVDEGMGGALLGTAERPSYCGGPAWMFDNGNGLVMIVTPRLADIVIDITLHVISIPTQSNFSSPG